MPAYIDDDNDDDDDDDRAVASTGVSSVRRRLTQEAEFP